MWDFTLLQSGKVSRSQDLPETTGNIYLKGAGKHLAVGLATGQGAGNQRVKYAPEEKKESTERRSDADVLSAKQIVVMTGFLSTLGAQSVQHFGSRLKCLSMYLVDCHESWYTATVPQGLR